MGTGDVSSRKVPSQIGEEDAVALLLCAICCALRGIVLLDHFGQVGSVARCPVSLSELLSADGRLSFPSR
jgi:hypothetical protein